MSERWSFATEHLYCIDCANAVRKTARATMDFSQPGRGLQNTENRHIVVGYGGGLASWEPREEMRKMVEALCGAICHEVRLVAFYDDDMTEMFFIRPRSAH